MNNQPRLLIVIADDFGIGPKTSAAILELAKKGIVTGSVLLVNSPFAAADVASWQGAGKPMELGWHPNLTLDRPILSPHRVPSLVSPQGRFWPLRSFLVRWFRGKIQADHVALEWQAQWDRFVELVGHSPRVVNSHQHVALFEPAGQILLDLLKKQRLLPYFRRVREPWHMLWKIRGARKKRAFLNWAGRALAKKQQALGFPGNDWLAGITAPPLGEKQRIRRELDRSGSRARGRNRLPSRLPRLDARGPRL